MAIRTVKSNGARLYYNEDTPAVRYPSVTSIVGMLPKPFLQRWAANMAADIAVDCLPLLQDLAARDSDGARQYIAGAAYRYTRERARIGSDAHDLFERMIRGENPANVHPDMRHYQRHFADFLDTVQPELIRAEDVAWSDTHKYAGSFDGILRVRLNEDGRPDPTGDPVTVIADWKTSKSVHADVALQMAAYANADVVISPDGRREPMPALDGAVILHVTPEQWTLKAVRADDDVFAYFLTLRNVYDWDADVSRKVLGRALAASRDNLVTGTQRRA